MDFKILASGRWWRRGGLEDLGAALGGDCEASTGVKMDGEVDMIACYEAPAVGKEEEQRDRCCRRCLGIGFAVECRCFGSSLGVGLENVWSRRQKLERVSVDQSREAGIARW